MRKRQMMSVVIVMLLAAGSAAAYPPEDSLPPVSPNPNAPTAATPSGTSPDTDNHSTVSGRDTHGNPLGKDVHGNPNDLNVQGNRPKDAQGDAQHDIYGNKTGTEEGK